MERSKPSQVKDLSAQELATWLSGAEHVRLIDVRTSSEASRGMIAQAENVPLHLLPLQEEQVVARRRVVFYCRSGARSEQACLFMSMRGHPEVYNLRGGLLAWLAHGLPIAAMRN